MSFREDQKIPGFVYILKNLDPTWANRIKVGLSVDPHERGKQLFTTGVPFPYWTYHAWAVTNMAIAEAIAHNVLIDHRIANNREHFDIIPMHRREEILGAFREPEDFEIDSCLGSLVELIDIEYQCSNLFHYSVDTHQLRDYSIQRKKTAQNPDNPDAYGPLF
ncbi:GIY-YIG nuclease family protein [Diaphorobacter sp.]|uniref:GIY-YIG nuclease family protein n=1 Tax=Diaphorobacter sp. TaxID=1934310 RepID=UPI002582829B|nr:GIY-YIG nuclease family protein [Diaphorobacter sp.]